MALFKGASEDPDGCDSVNFQVCHPSYTSGKQPGPLLFGNCQYRVHHRPPGHQTQFGWLVGRLHDKLPEAYAWIDFLQHLMHVITLFPLLFVTPVGTCITPLIILFYSFSPVSLALSASQLWCACEAFWLLCLYIAFTQSLVQFFMSLVDYLFVHNFQICFSVFCLPLNVLASFSSEPCTQGLKWNLKLFFTQIVTSPIFPALVNAVTTALIRILERVDV